MCSAVVLYPSAVCYEAFTNIEVALNSALVSTGFSTVPLKNDYRWGKSFRH
jgi:hypothetical protein